ncbi:MAG TPA: ABC transporter permease [Beutenbergiaceae bacterium]|nr:ABC transporter permease [Beutenbergiaceae bacterium]
MSSLARPLKLPRAAASARLRRRRVVVPWLVLGLAFAAALVPGIFTSYDPIAGSGAALQAPSLEHWFGTDATGRDVFTRVVHGAANSLSAAVIAVAVGLSAGSVLGLLAGNAGGALDAIIMRGVDVLLAIPSLLLALSIIILLGFGPAQAAVAVGVTSIAAFARLMRSRVIEVRASEYVEAAYASGGRTLGVVFRHILPNSLTAVLALAALHLGTAILAISTLGFLGYGAPPPTPEWGLMIAEGRDYVATAWWLTTLPGLVVIAVVLAANRLSSHLGRTR